MLIFAHRGASADAPENTLGAIFKALDMGVDGIEIDVHEVDGEYVVIHDRWLHRTTSQSRTAVVSGTSVSSPCDCDRSERNTR